MLLNQWLFLQHSNNSTIWKDFAVMLPHSLLWCRIGKLNCALGCRRTFYPLQERIQKLHFFSSSLVDLCHGLAQIQATGTDGENSIIEALKHQFRDVTLLRCFCHLQETIGRHCKELNLPTTAMKATARKYFPGME